MFYRNLGLRKKYRNKIVSFIKNNPGTTYREIRQRLKIHPERVFKKGLAEAFKEAGVNPPRTFKIRSKEEKRKVIIDYIRKNPGVGGHIISKNTKINYSSVFAGMKEAYDLAGVEYAREENTKLKRRKAPDKKREIISLVRKNPLISISQIYLKTKIQPYRLFRNMGEIYREAGVKAVSKGEKRNAKKRKLVIDFVRANPLATQREINKVCKTHVQHIFNKGIFEAYEKAGVKFPYERLKLYGVGIKKIRDRARRFEDQISVRLSGYGKVSRLVKTKRGISDIMFERKGRKAIIEIKDYQSKEISVSEIKQLHRYMEDSNSNLGILICRKKPGMDKFLIGGSQIFVLEEFELNRIPKIMGI